jgi:hypothetical protein
MKASGPALVPMLSGNTASDAGSPACFGTPAAEDPGTLQSGGSGAMRCWARTWLGVSKAPAPHITKAETTFLSSSFMSIGVPKDSQWFVLRSRAHG